MSTTEVKIPLDPPVEIGSKRYEYIRVRAPTYQDFLDIGEPVTFQPSEGEPVAVEHLDRFREYASRCVRTGDDPIADPAVLAEGGFRLARKVQRAIADFLYGPVPAAGTTLPTT